MPAGSVTALEIADVSHSPGVPVAIVGARIDATDTGPTGTFRLYLYSSDPTASSGVQAGDNAAFANKRAGLVGTMTGEALAMNDGAIIQFAPESGAGAIVADPANTSRSLWWQLQSVDGFTPSANSTTFTVNLMIERGLRQ